MGEKTRVETVMAEEMNVVSSFFGVELPSPSRRLEFRKMKSDLDKLNIFSVNWNLADHVRTIGLFILYFLGLGMRVLFTFVPQRMDVCGISTALDSLGNPDSPTIRVALDTDQDHLRIKSSGAIGRALLQVLSLVNDLPASSRKYAFARALTEKIIAENLSHGHGFESVNRVALSAGFQRTLAFLNETLASLHQQKRVGTIWSVPLKFIVRMLPGGGMALPLPAPLSLVRSTIGGFLNPSPHWAHVFPPTRIVYEENGTLMAEKLAEELLWLAQKLSECSALEEAINQWSSCSSLASMALSAKPRIQRSMVRLTALLVHGIVQGNVDVAREVKFKLLLHWIPLFCTATHGGDGVIFNTTEKVDAEKTLAEAIRNLPESDQEVLLAIWLQEYAMSPSDWPNLQSCYDSWCFETRKVGHRAHLDEGK
ncbi:protein MpLDPS2 [Marchantia polymorpha subsp. ruderalis]|uniref:At3g05675-like ankyrin-like domain-containing protein n=1 Tax=Marchantia polymorpha TaxID=3197 RepID=A0A2R6WKF5_MARPO|nr:hypothetical protein MARPO_0081s0028 [Marchantia polymorpha]BBN18762.1 hypothetical protein Mp_8g05270 [Marchantia polymorpha subsp. ruderalis]|eukprot:PTQ34301.1 hypothetical protein MARPO_0081s0028 [Marchantia polymorpha]